jgi:hypothetical protein
MLYKDFDLHVRYSALLFAENDKSEERFSHGLVPFSF